MLKGSVLHTGVVAALAHHDPLTLLGELGDVLEHVVPTFEPGLV